MKKTLRNKKALSPVIAAIILIAVTVAVAIAVAAWMGALTISFMGTETIQIKKIKWKEGDGFVLTIRNTGTSPVTINYIKMNTLQITKANDTITFPLTIETGVTETYNVTAVSWTSGDSYDIGVVTSEGTAFTKPVTGGEDY